jgi:hypothetical protein
MQSGQELPRQPRAGQALTPVPRWRLVNCMGRLPARVARSVAQRLRGPGALLPGWGEPRYSSCAYLPSGTHVFTATGSSPVGTALARLFAALPGDTSWLNSADLALVSRGYSPAALRLVKQAAAQACSTVARRLSSFTLTPLPHLPGELLVRHSSGWTGRARAWQQEEFILALAWQC